MVLVQEDGKWNETAARADTSVDNFVRGIIPDSTLKGRRRGRARSFPRRAENGESLAIVTLDLHPVIA